MRKLTAIADIDKSKTIYVEKDKFVEAFKQLSGRYLITFDRVYNKITARQHRTNYVIPYVIIADALTDAWGRKVEVLEVDEICKENCFPESAKKRQKEQYDLYCRELYSKDSKLIPKFRLTKTDLSTVEQNEYYVNMQNWGMEILEVDIPDPDPKKAKDYNKSQKL